MFLAGQPAIILVGQWPAVSDVHIRGSVWCQNPPEGIYDLREVTTPTKAPRRGASASRGHFLISHLSMHIPVSILKTRKLKANQVR